MLEPEPDESERKAGMLEYGCFAAVMLTAMLWLCSDLCGVPAALGF